MNMKHTLSNRLAKSSFKVKIVSDKEDCQELFKSVKAYYQELEPEKKLDDKKLLQKIIYEVIENENSNYIAFIIKRENQLVGCLILTIGTPFVSDEKIVSNLLLYIFPAFRGTLAAMKLLIAYQQWAQLQEVTEINIFVTSNYNTKGTNRLLRKLGFNMIGMNYRKELVYNN